MNKNAWRWSLDPRDPDYDDPPIEDDFDDEPAPELESLDDDPRCNGSWNYWPMRGDV